MVRDIRETHLSTASVLASGKGRASISPEAPDIPGRLVTDRADVRFAASVKVPVEGADSPGNGLMDARRGRAVAPPRIGCGLPDRRQRCRRAPAALAVLAVRVGLSYLGSRS
jgi:hypothetical protein